MTAKEQLLQEIEQAPEELIEAILKLLRSIKARSNWQPSTTVSAPESSNSLQDLFNEFDQFAQSIPSEELVNLHTDSAEQHDHYLYGTVKRPE
ncbi:MAG: hypothetical protein HC895_10135 [Leptolyngbyaceae cyanobacterium SM1_3_5]|nr:hypothetical protein [Leptolyngbyaceae cyanobacterium SM1_3_5]